MLYSFISHASVIFLPGMLKEKSVLRIFSPMHIAFFTEQLFGSILCSFANWISFTMKDGTATIVVGLSRKIVSHCSEGTPGPRRMIPAPSLRMPA